MEGEKGHYLNRQGRAGMRENRQLTEKAVGVFKDQRMLVSEFLSHT